MNSIEIVFSILSLEITMTSETSINNSTLLALPTAQVLVKTVVFVAAKISTSQMYQLFLPYISWDKYHQMPSYTFLVVLFSKWPL